MKKARLFTLLTLIAMIILLIFVGCNKKADPVSSVSLKDVDPNTAIEMAVGDFDYHAYTVVVVYQSGRTEEIPLTEEMIEQTDMFKLYQVGEHDISVCYENYRYTFKVSVKRATFGNLAFPENNVFTYDGKPHVVEVDGNIPANAVVTYPGGNSFVNAGTYDVTAVVSCEGYVTENLATTVTIERAKYDMSGVKFESKEVVYDGNAHSIAISGTLPEGVSAPTYMINEKVTSSATDVGEYTVIAQFANSDPNYEAIPTMEATLKITPAEYTVKGVDVIFRNEDGNLIADASKIYDGKSVTFDLNDYNKLSKKVLVSFSVYDKDGKRISTSNQKTNIINAGVYTVKVEFTLTDGKNYKPLTPLVRTFEVLKAAHPPIENIQFPSAQITYDGNEHSIAIVGQPPSDVKVSYEYYKDGELVVGADGTPVKAVIDVGSYVVKAVFTHENENLGEIAEALATLNIKKMIVDLSAVGFIGDKSVEYSGGPYEPILTTWKDTNETDYEILQYASVKYYVFDSTSGKYVEMEKNERPTEIGLYRVATDVSILDEYSSIYTFDNGADIDTVSRQFEIVKKEIALPSIQFASNSEREYTGAGQEIGFELRADSSLMTVSTAYYQYEVGTYVAMQNGEKPTELGSYKFVVTVTLNDASHYVLPNGTASAEVTFVFDIVAKPIDVNGLTFDSAEIFYNGSNRYPSFVELPAHVQTTVSLYASDGTPIEEAINAGEYRCEIVLSPENGNYTLSGQTTYSAEFEIKKQRINLNDILVQNTKYIYTGNDLSLRVFEDLSPEIKNMLSYSVWYTYIRSNGELVEYYYPATSPGDYRIAYHLSIKSEYQSNVTLFVSGQEVSGLDPCYDFSIVPLT